MLISEDSQLTPVISGPLGSFRYHNLDSSLMLFIAIYLQGGPKKSLWIDLEEKCLRNSKMFFDGVFLSIYSHLLKKLELLKLCRKKLWDSKNPKNWCSKLVNFFLKVIFPFLKCTTRKMFDYEEIFFLFYMLLIN